MSDLIERQTAIEAIMKAAQEIEDDIHLSLTMAQGARSMAVEIERLPSAQPERKTGKWIKVSESRGICLYKCSECGNLYLCKHSFCPNCGADMRGG